MSNKIGPREAQLRAMREGKQQKVVISKEAFEALRKAKAKGIGKVVNMKSSGVRRGK